MNDNDNNTQDQAAEASTQEAPVNGADSQIKSVNEFGALLFNWHHRQIATINHFLDIPEGIEVKVGEEEQITLSGDVLRGYKLGLELSLHYLGTLPFNYTPDEVVKEEVTEETTPADDAAPANH